MDIQELNEVMSCLDDERRLMHYYKDRFVVYYMERLLDKSGPQKIGVLKQSELGRLCGKPVMSEILRTCGNGLLTVEHIEQFFPEEFESYVLTLSRWGEAAYYPWEQTSRPGTNLVLQMNMTNEHEEYVRKNNINKGTFNCCGHPVHEEKSSLSWARIDFDMDTGEALIEEIQNDWLRRVKRHNIWSKRCLNNGKVDYRVRDEQFHAPSMLRYTTRLLKKHAKTWSEAMLFAAIHFVREELGIGTIYYHTEETGKCLKNIEYGLPPKSIYSDLPQKFCFESVNEGPEFIMSCRKIKKRLRKIKDKHWYVLNL